MMARRGDSDPTARTHRAGALSSIALLVCAGGLPACLDSSAEILGNYLVTGTLTETCAETGLLAVPDQHGLVVTLTQVGTSLHWREGQRLLIGSIDEQRSFEVEGYLHVNMRQDTPDADLPPCYIDRWELKTGELDYEDGACSGFSGQLIFHMEPSDGSDCSDLMTGSEPLATELPCDVVYDVEAEPI